MRKSDFVELLKGHGLTEDVFAKARLSCDRTLGYPGRGEGLRLVLGSIETRLNEQERLRYIGDVEGAANAGIIARELLSELLK